MQFQVNMGEIYVIDFAGKNQYTLMNIPLYHTWENFGGGKFWRINESKAIGEEKFGESASSQSKKSYSWAG